MTIIFHPNICQLAIGRGILGAGYTSASGISIYSGVQPLATDIITNWSTYNSNNAKFLAHYYGGIWSHPLGGAATFCSLTTFPAPVNASNTGTASWCILWTTNPTAPQLASAGIPTATFLIGPVSILTDNGIIRFNPDLSFTAGVSKAIADGVISVSST